MNSLHFSSEQDEFIKKNLLEKKSITWLAQQLHCDRHALSNYAKKLMGPTFDFKRKSYVNLDFFEIINSPEKAYWLGFLAADGYIVGNELNIQLQQSDKAHLQKFSDAINGNLTIRDINGKNNFGTEYHHYRVSIKSDKIVKDLSQYGIVPNKSLILTKPDIPKEYYPYWIIGYMDGDGCISKNKKKIRISFTGTLSVLQFIRDYLNSQAVINLEHRCSNTYCLQIENNISISFLDKMNYINLSFALDRKKQIVALYSSLTQQCVLNNSENCEEALKPI